jgi:phage terminase small subunit
MPKPRDPRRDKAREIYHSNSETPLVDIANQLDLPESTVRGWKSKDKWESGTVKKMNGTLRKNTERSKPLRSVPKDVTPLNEDSGLNDRQRLFCHYYVYNPVAATAYQKAYKCSRETSLTNGPRLLAFAHIKKEVARQMDIFINDNMISERHVFWLYWRIAFADMNDYVEYENKRVPIICNGKLAKEKDPKTGEEKIISEDANVVKLKSSSEVDGQVISSITEGRDGVSVKLADKHKALEWLSRWFKMYPMDKHRIDYENARLELERAKQNDNSGSVLEVRIKPLSPDVEAVNESDSET